VSSADRLDTFVQFTGTVEEAHPKDPPGPPSLARNAGRF
jgi:hypothetical protein